MSLGRFASYMWKLLVCVIAFFIEMVLSGALPTLMSLQSLAIIPEGTGANTV